MIETGCQTSRAGAAPRVPLTVSGLFAGIGGIELGLVRAGHRIAHLCEIDPSARRVLAERFDIGCHVDVRDLADLPPVDLLAAGFPCQDLSQAGRTVGIGGRQSSLVEHVFRLAGADAAPDWILLENVPFMLRLEAGAGMHFLTSRLCGLGYRWAYRVVDTRAFGLPQRRRRVILLASRSADPRSVMLADDAGEPPVPPFDEASAVGFYWTEGSRGLGWAPDAVPPLKAGSGVGIPSPPAVWRRGSDDLVTPDVRDAERLQGFPVDWTASAADDLDRRREGIRWRLVGNAVSVPVAQWVGERVASPGSYERLVDDPLPTSAPWPSAAWGDESGAYRADVSAWPVRRACPGIADFLRLPGRPLSRRATVGFGARLSKSSLRTPDEFKQAVVRHADRMPVAVRAGT